MQIRFTFKATMLFVMAFILIFGLQVFIVFKLTDPFNLMMPTRTSSPDSMSALKLLAPLKLNYEIPLSGTCQIPPKAFSSQVYERGSREM